MLTRCCASPLWVLCTSQPLLCNDTRIRSDTVNPVPEEWTDHAACRDHAEVFFPEVPPDAPRYNGWEHDSAVRSKQICVSCPVFGDCAAVALDVTQVPVGTQGVWAAMTRWERDWIRKNPAAAVELSQQLKEAGVDPIVLSMVRVSPDPSELGATTAESAEQFGVPDWVAAEWHRRREISRGSTPWGEAIRGALAAEPDRWFLAVELVDRYSHLIPAERIRARREQRKRHGSSCTDRAAASTIIGGVIYTGIRKGYFERRLTRDGRLEVRRARSLALAA